MTPGLGRWRSKFCGTGRDCSGMGGSKVLGDQGDLHAERLVRVTRMDMAALKVGVSELMRGEGQGRCTSLKLPVRA